MDDGIKFTEQGVDVAIYKHPGLLEIILEDDCLDRLDGGRAELRLHSIDDAIRLATALMKAVERTLEGEG